MPSYTGSAAAPDRARAIGAVVAIHVALAFIILSGLHVGMVRQAVEHLRAFDLQQPPPPPPVTPPRPQPREAAKQAAGAPAKRADPAPVVAPPPQIPAPSPIPAAKIAGTGAASTSGAAAVGNETGAGGTGNGTGGGGYGDYSGFTPARLVRNLSRGDYRSIAQGRMPAGRAMVALRVERDGTASNCRIARSSGDSVIDGALCPLVQARLRFSPALDAQGRPIPYQLQYVATWSL